MKRIILYLAILLLHDASAQKLVCSDNEVFNNCSNPCDGTCESPRINCLWCQPGQSCACAAGFVRNSDNVCIPLEKCECPANEHRSSCGNLCEPTCNNQYPICTEQCELGNPCTCDEGFVRDSDGKCSPASNCQCPPNERMSPCLNTCEPTCENLTPVCTKECKIGSVCTCANGFVRHQGVCIAKEKCPSCGKNQVYKSCGTACPGSCRNPLQVGVGCIRICKEGCFCKEGYTRNRKGDCVKISDCSNADCGLNEVFLSCGSPCGLGCPGSQPTPCKAACYPGCFCAKGYIRDSDSGKCVKNQKC